MTLPYMMQGFEINILLLILLGLTLGVVSGFVGVGGGFMMTPALIILGLPAHLAVGTSLTWVMGNSIVGTIRHRKLGNVDMKLGMFMVISSVGGVEVGVRILNWTKSLGFTDIAVLSTSIFMLLLIGAYTFWETSQRKSELDGKTDEKEKILADKKTTSFSAKLQAINLFPRIHFAKSGITISLWPLLIIGFLTGTLAGFIGVGGGFIMVPSLIYLIGLPSFTAVGTDMFQIIFLAAFGSTRHIIDGNVIIVIAAILLLGSFIGTQFGVHVTRYVRAISMRYVFASSVLVAAIGSILKLTDIVSKSSIPWLQPVVIAITFVGLGLVLSMIVSLFIMSLMYRNGKRIPKRIESLVS